MGEQVQFGPYRVLRRFFVLLVLAEAAPVAGVLGALADWEGHLAIRWSCGLVLAALAFLGLWAMLSCTAIVHDHVEVRILWRVRRIPWSRIQAIRVESDPGREALGSGPTESVVVYDESGRRINLPFFDNMNLHYRGLSLAHEVAGVRRAWQERRGADWVRLPEVSARIADREQHGDPARASFAAASLGAMLGLGLFLIGLFTGAIDEPPPLGWVLGWQALLAVPVTLTVAVTVVGGRRRRRRLAAAMPQLTRTFLVARLAARSDWPAMWRSVRDMPIVEAATEVHRFSGWRPPGGPDLALFDRLAAADPGRLATALRELAPDGPVSLTPGEIVVAGALSPDEARLAVATMVEVSAPNVVSELTLPDRPGHRYEIDGPWITDLLHLGDAIIVRVEEFMGATKLVRCADGAAEVFGQGVELARLRQTRDGFVAVTRNRGLAFGTAHDDRLRRVSLADDLGLAVNVALDASTLATEPSSNLIALGGAELVVIDVDTTAVVARGAPPTRSMKVGQVVFVGNDRLVTQIGRGRRDRNGAAVWNTLASWQLTRGALIYQGAVPARTWGAMWPAAIPTDGQVVTPLFETDPVRGGTPIFRDASTLRVDVPPVPSVAGLTGVTEMAAGPGGHQLVVLRRSDPDVDHDDTIEVHQLRPLHHLLRRPLGELAATDSTTALFETGGPTGSPAARELLELFDACLHHRRSAGQTTDKSTGR
ncbi:hypothetical protein I6A60_36770 [Frankia sp. AgB1.9]|uniref:hypothetical protein n=1 Tax=unclassified Frankia TaxID=2632575 RepID=UPI001932E498|nr:MULTISPECIES: hypothetical protein [unclassified Frankia]MBL7493382.1 hypothetical protein [Frankia sp. AgW1.1]MBL7553364.1 hypothetical protein [Frankia sp. AgB1.9]MBL7624874.1 hypothetical protein [Frankia sp. AgB1.8]